MQTMSTFSLPALVGGQYVFTAVLRETADTVLYAATQKNMRREVVVETLRPHAMTDPLKEPRFHALHHSSFCLAECGGGASCH